MSVKFSFSTVSRQKSHCRSRSGTRFSELGTRFPEREGGGGTFFIARYSLVEKIILVQVELFDKTS